MDRSLIGVLIFGKYRVAADRNLKALHQWIDEVISRSPELRAEQVAHLHELANRIPVLEPRTKSALDLEVTDAVELAEMFLSRALNVGAAFRGEDLIRHLGLEQPEVNISMEELWVRIQAALQKITQALPVLSAAAFWANYRNTSEMRRMASYPTDLTGIDCLPLASPADFEWLQGESWVNIPTTEEGFFTWLSPKALLDTDYGVLFGREMIGGHIVVLAFGYGPERLAPFQRTILYDAVTSRLFRFIDNALFGIELDHLMAETGHLMGRAVGKVAVGVKTLQKIIPANVHDDEKYQLALWAMEDGQTRLELIQHNFYSFQTRRRGAEPTSKELPEPMGEENIENLDVIEIVESMRSFFDRAVKEAELKPIVYHLTDEATPVIGDRNALRLTLLNLFDNALKFSYSNTYIVIEVSVEGHDCRVVFKNLGVGVAKNERQSVFKPFTKSRYRNPYKLIEGLGLGLSYCRWVVEDIFRGRISLTSGEAQAPNRKFEGDNWLTMVMILLPLGVRTA